MHKYTIAYCIDRMHCTAHIDRETIGTVKIKNLTFSDFSLICKVASITSRKGSDFISENIIIALLSLIGTGVGAFGGILASSKLTNYRIKKLEEKVDKHNSFAERIPVLKEQIKVLNHRMEDIEKLCNHAAKM